MHIGSCTHQFRVYSAGFKLIQGPRRVIKSSKITIERALNSDKALGGNVADWSFPGQRDRPRSKCALERPCAKKQDLFHCSFLS